MRWLSGIRGRIALILAVAASATISLVGISLWSGKRVQTSIKNMTEIRLPSIKGLEAMNEGQTAVAGVLMEIEFDSRADMGRLWERYESKRKQIQDGFKAYEPLPQTPDEAAEYNGRFLDLWTRWEKATDAYAAFKRQGQHAKASEALTEFRTTFVSSEQSLAKLIEINYRNSAADERSALDAAALSLRLMILVGLAGLALVLTFGLRIANSVSRTLTEVSARLRDASSNVASASAQVASAASQLSQSTTEQASSLQETAASLEEISSMVSKSSESAGQASKSSELSNERAAEGRRAVERMRAGMDEISGSNDAIKERIEAMNGQMAEIVKVIRDIGSKTKVIHEIVFQTKLLSFNASVEAARAGEHGKGFAVVAEEVGNLARMSGTASQEISSMLDASVAKVESIARATQTSIGEMVQAGGIKIEAGVKIAHDCASMLTQIEQDVSETARLSREISLASKEQSQGVAEINSAMTQIEQTTQQNAATSEQAANAAAALSAQAASLQSSVETLMRIVGGPAADSVAPSQVEVRYEDEGIHARAA